MLERLPAGIVPDASAVFSWFAFQNNANAYCGQLTTAATTGIAYVVANVVLPRVLRLTSGASGGFTVTLPTAQQMISAFGPTIPQDGSYGQLFSLMNDNVGQTATLTAGDSNTTLTGTMTVATNTRRDFFVTITGVGLITVQNLGSVSL